MQNEVKSEVKSDSIFDRVVDFIFSEDNKKYVLLFVIVAMIFRYLITNNVILLADEMIHGMHSMDIIKAGVINLQNQCPAWYYATDIAYNLLGVTAFAGRFLSFFFGSLAVILVYLIAKELYNKKIALIASFLIAVSGFSIRYSLMEMDLTMIFFILFAFYYFIRDIKKKNKLSYLTAVLLGVAILIKPITLPFIASFLLYFLFFMNKEERKVFAKRNKKEIIVSLIILFLFTMPILAFNYILYTQKGISDVIFSRFLEINQGVYSQLQGYDQTFSVSDFFNYGLPTVFKSSFIPMDTPIFILGLLGILLIFFSSKYKNGRFLVALHIVPFIFLVGTSWLQTHLVSFMPVLCISAAVFIDYISEYLGKDKNYKKVAMGIVAIVLVLNLFYLWPHLTSGSAILKMRDYASENIVGRDVVIVDARIYRGRIAWMFNDKFYLEASYLEPFLKYNENDTGQKVLTNMYFVECIRDDCGWGTIKDQPEFNASMEQIVAMFKQNAVLEKVIYGGGGDPQEESAGEPILNVYKTQIMMSPSLYQTIKDTHEWFYYPVRWDKDDWYDKYTPQGAIQESLHIIGKIMLWIAVLIICFIVVVLLAELFDYPIKLN